MPKLSRRKYSGRTKISNTEQGGACGAAPAVFTGEGCMASSLKKLLVLSTLIYPLSLINQVILSWNFGTSLELDTFWTGYAALVFLCSPVLASREALSLEIRHMAIMAPQQVSSIFSRRLNALFLMALFICGFVWLTAFPLVSFLSGGREEIRRCLLTLFPLQTGGVLLLTLNETLSATLTASGDAMYNQWGRLCGVVASILLVPLTSACLGVNAMALALLVSSGMFLFAQLCVLHHRGIRYEPLHMPSLPGPFAAATLPVLVYLLLTQGVAAYARLALQQNGVSAVSGYQYALSIYGIPENIILFSVHGTLWALLSRNTPDISEAGEEYRRVWSLFKTVAVVMACVTCLLFLFDKAIVRLLLMRGAFNEQSLGASAHALALIALGLVPQSLSLLYGRYMLQRHGTAVSLGWGLQATAGGVCITVGLWLNKPDLILLHNALGAITAIAFFHLFLCGRAHCMARCFPTAFLFRLTLVTLVTLCIPVPDIAALPVIRQWFALPALGCLYGTGFLLLCMILKMPSAEDFRVLRRLFYGD